ncbi:MAG: nucleotidyltransferase domain-containing protein [Lachnospiraceae bacterium]|nr:nucleotidyltransferase domain-containing protein [Lachnospiraceae bacterium]
MNTFPKNDLDKILEKMFHIYKEIYKNDICHVYLYGSYARGDFSNGSDIDIVAIVKGERKDLQEKLKQIWELSADMELDYEIIISPTVIPYEEFNHYQNILPYYRNILKEGIELSA